MATGEMADATSVDGSELKVVETAAEVAPDDGGDVASRDPDAIAREIEQTRSELADTIDAIADRINPKRAASRSAQAVKAQVSGVRAKVPGIAGPDSDVAPTPPSHAASSQLPVGPIVAIAALLVAITVLLRKRRSR
jgi:hypothetical protein